MEHSKLLSLLRNVSQIDEKEETFIRSYFEPVSYPKNTILIELDTVATHLYFINEGFARAYHIQDGVEVTNHLASPNVFITAFNSFTSKTRSDECVVTVTACEMLRITKDNLSTLYHKSHNMALFGITMYERYLVFNNQRGKDFVTLTAEQRYLKFVKEEPLMLQHIPLQYIASYLGIEPPSLSRIRRRIIS